MMRRLVYSYTWFAWRPVKTESGKWVWWRKVTKTVDERPIEYLGLMESIYYEVKKN